jgi:Tfp pilus assembly protein PilX
MRHPLYLKQMPKIKAFNKKSTTQGKGFALAAVMLILVVTAMISATAIKTGLLNENLAQSQNQVNDARQNAEITLRDGIDHVMCAFQNNGQGNGTAPIVNAQLFTANDPFDVPVGQCQGGLCGGNLPNQPPVWQTLHQNTPAIEFARYGEFTNSQLINRNLGRYLIEAVQTTFAHGNGASSMEEYQYRITSVGFSEQNPRVYKKLQVLMRPVDQKCSYNSQTNLF